MRGARSAPRTLPCLNTNNCNEGEVNEPLPKDFQKLSSGHRKVAAALKRNVARLADRYGLERLGFLTLTFKTHIVCAREAQRRFHSLATGVLNGRYAEWIRVLERMKSGRIHYHLLVVADEDVRTGADFEAFDKDDYRSGNARLHKEWRFWRTKTRGGEGTCEKYGFGPQHEFLPVKSTQEAIATYVGKYIAKHIGARNEEDKGVRLVTYSRNAGANSSRFSWTSPGQDLHRKKMALFCGSIGLHSNDYAARLGEMLGPNWIFKVAPLVESIRLDVYPTMAHIVKDYPQFTGPWGWHGDPRSITDCSINGGRDHKPSMEAARRAFFAVYLQARARFAEPVQTKWEEEEAAPMRAPARSWMDFTNNDP